MVKLYRNAAHPNSWVAYIKESGLGGFPGAGEWLGRSGNRLAGWIRCSLRKVPLKGCEYRDSGRASTCNWCKALLCRDSREPSDHERRW